MMSSEKEFKRFEIEEMYWALRNIENYLSGDLDRLDNLSCMIALAAIKKQIPVEPTDEEFYDKIAIDLNEKLATDYKKSMRLYQEAIAVINKNLKEFKNGHREE